MASRAAPTTAPARNGDPAAGELDADRTETDLSAVIGYHVRAFRRELGLSLRGLSERSGLSIGFLSQLERGLSSIGLTTLRDLAATLGHEITEFFDATPFSPDVEADDDDAAAIDAAAESAERGRGVPPVDRYFTLTRASGEHTTQYVSGQTTYRMLSKRAPGLALEPMLVSIAPGATVGELEVHGGEEFAYVLKGELCYLVDGVEHRLSPGDSLHLLSTIPHGLRNDTTEVTLVVSVVTPRLF